MKIRKGCDVLSARLTELLHQATAVRRSVLLVGRNATDTERLLNVEESFNDMAAFVADTLGDVNDRLQRLDEVLKVIHSESSRAPEPSSAC
jgi:hypothetical protein